MLLPPLPPQQADAAAEFEPAALEPLAGERGGRAAALLVRLALLVALVGGLPLQVALFRCVCAQRR